MAADDLELDALVRAEAALQEREAAWLRDPEYNTSRKRKRSTMPRKIYRSKAYAWLLQVDNQLRMPPLGGLGLSMFRPAEPVDTMSPDDLLRIPCLVVSSDQGPDAWCALHWAEDTRFGNLNIQKEPDSHNHGIHNDTCNALGEVKLRGFMYALTLVYNMHFLPWQTGAFGNKLRAAREQLDTVQSYPPAFLHFMQQIAFEKGMLAASIGGDGAREIVWRHFLDSQYLNNTGQRVAMMRWYQVFVRTRTFVHDWTSAIVCLLRACSLEPWLQTTYLHGEQPDLQAAPVPAASGGKTSTKDTPKDAIKALRFASKNLMHFVLQFLLVPLHRRLAFLIATLTESTQMWYHTQAQTLKNSCRNRQWASEQLLGDFYIPLRETMGRVSSASALERMAFNVNFAGADPAGERSSEYYDDIELGELCGKFTASLVRRRLLRSAWFTDGWPSRFSLLLASEAIRDSLLQELRVMCDTYDQVQAQDTVSCNAYWSQRPMRLLSVSTLLGPIRAANFTLPDAVARQIELRGGCFKQSRVVENGFLHERAKEAASKNQRMSDITVFDSVQRSSILGTRFEFDELRVDFPKRDGPLLDEASFRPRARDSSIDLTSVKGTQRQAGWLTKNPEASVALHLQPGLLRTLCQARCLDHVENVWLTNLLPNSEPLLLREGMGEDEAGPRQDYVLVLGVCASTAVVGWPVKLVADFNGNHFYEPRSDADATPVYKYIYNTKWDVATCVWAPPWQQLAEYGAPSHFVSRSSAKLRLVIVRGPQNFIAAGAHFAWWRTSELDLRKLAQLEGRQELLAEKDFPLFLESLVRAYLPEMDDTQIYNILMKRVFRDAALDDIMNDPELRQHLDAKDLEELDNASSKRESTEKGTRKKFFKSLKRLKEKVCAMQRDACQTMASDERTRGPAHYMGMPGDWSHALVSHWLPPSARILRDERQARWRVWWMYGSLSRSWALYGCG